MLDYNKLATEIDTYIESLDKEFIEDWFNETYDEINLLLEGKSLEVESEYESYDIDSESDIIIGENDYSYRNAA